MNRPDPSSARPRPRASRAPSPAVPDGSPGPRGARPRAGARPKGRRLPKRVRHAVNSLHVVTSVGLVGIVWTGLALGLVARSTDDPALAHDTYRLMDTLVHVTALPFAVAAMATGLVLAFGTPWGLFRHLWVTVKFVLLVAVVVLGVAAIGPWVGGLADASAPGGDAGRLPELRNYQFAAGAAQLAALVAATALSVFKPSGRRARPPRPAGTTNRGESVERDVPVP